MEVEPLSTILCQQVPSHSIVTSNDMQFIDVTSSSS